MDKLLDNNYRIKYYLKKSCYGSHSFFKRNIKNGDFINLNDNQGENNYSNDLIKIIRKNKLKREKEIKYCPRDRVELFFDAPTLVKSRMISDKDHYSILMKLNIDRHFRDIQEVKKHDIPFHKKKMDLFGEEPQQDMALEILFLKDLLQGKYLLKNIAIQKVLKKI